MKVTPAAVRIAAEVVQKILETINHAVIKIKKKKKRKNNETLCPTFLNLLQTLAIRKLAVGQVVIQAVIQVVGQTIGQVEVGRRAVIYFCLSRQTAAMKNRGL